MSKKHSNDKTYLLNLIAGTGGLPSMAKFGEVATQTGKFAAIIVNEDGTTFSEIKIDGVAITDLVAKGLDQAMNNGALLTAGAGETITSFTVSAGQALAYRKPQID